jgi:hypothetical protein
VKAAAGLRIAHQSMSAGCAPHGQFVGGLPDGGRALAMAASREKGEHNVMEGVDDISIEDPSMAETGPGEEEM